MLTEKYWVNTKKQIKNTDLINEVFGMYKTSVTMTSQIPCLPAMDFSFASASVKTFYTTAEPGISGSEPAGLHFN